MKLYMIRHGETDNNVKHLFSGWFPAQLTDNGREQARCAGKRLEGVAFDKIYASDLERTMETARLIFPEGEITPEPALREIHVGTLGGRPYGESDAGDRAFSDYTPYGGENREQLLARIRPFVTSLETLPCERVAAVTHGGLICAMLDLITDCRIRTGRFTCVNCSVSVFEYIPERGWRLVKWNDTGDLP